MEKNKEIIKEKLKEIKQNIKELSKEQKEKELGVLENNFSDEGIIEYNLLEKIQRKIEYIQNNVDEHLKDEIKKIEKKIKELEIDYEKQKQKDKTQTYKLEKTKKE